MMIMMMIMIITITIAFFVCGKQSFDCNYTFLIDLVPNGISLGTKPIRKSVNPVQILFNSTITLCVYQK